MTDVTIYHNPRCSKSRETLALLEKTSATITIIKYLDTPPSIETLQQIITQLGFDSARQLMRTNEAIYKQLALKEKQDEITLLTAMMNNPKLIERPIVLANGKAAIGRPPQAVLAIV